MIRKLFFNSKSSSRNVDKPAFHLFQRNSKRISFFGAINILLLITSIIFSSIGLLVLIETHIIATPRRTDHPMYEIMNFPFFNLLKEDRVMLDLVLGTGVLTLIITIFGLLATGYRLCRPLLWIYASVVKRLFDACRKPYLAISHKIHKKPEKYTFSHKQSRIS